MDEKLVERLTRGALHDGHSSDWWVEYCRTIHEAAAALTAAEGRIKALEEAIWLAHDQLNTYRSAAVEEVIDKLETYIPGLSDKEAPNV